MGLLLIRDLATLVLLALMIVGFLLVLRATRSRPDQRGRRVR